MQNTVLVHPVHGTKVATLEAEIEQDKKSGWKVREDQPRAEPPAPPAPQVNTLAGPGPITAGTPWPEETPKRSLPMGVEQLRAEYEKRFGRKAHRALTENQLRDALADAAVV